MLASLIASDVYGTATAKPLAGGRDMYCTYNSFVCTVWLRTNKPRPALPWFYFTCDNQQLCLCCMQYNTYPTNPTTTKGAQADRQLKTKVCKTFILVVVMNSYLLPRYAGNLPRLCTPLDRRSCPRGRPHDGRSSGMSAGYISSKVRRDQPSCRLQPKLPFAS